jgi:hypothetical protein
MRSDELLTALRYSAFIGDAAQAPDYDDARLLYELTDVLKSVFTGMIVDARSGYWLQSSLQTTSTTDARYRIPDRATAGGLETVEFQDASGKFRRLDQLPEDQAYEYASVGASTGVPLYYVIRGDQLELLPTPSTAAPLRMSYYLRPSRLVQPQSSTLAPAPNNVVRGRIDAVNVGARTLTVNALPFDQELAAPAAITTALQLIDVVHPGGSYAPVLVGATQTIAALVITVGGTDSLADIQVGDYVRVAEQAEWPPLPEDYHRLAADIAAIKVMTQLDWPDKAQLLSAATAGDIERFKSLIADRVKSQPEQLVQDALISAVRLACGIPTNDQNYTVTRILQELNDAMQSVFTDAVVGARAGFWLKQLETTLTTTDTLRIPQRAATNGLEGVSIGSTAVNFAMSELIELGRRAAVGIDNDALLNAGEPKYFTLYGDVLRLVPPQSQSYRIRTAFYLRPSQIMPQQSVAIGGSVVRGQITAVNVGASTVTVNALPFDMSLPQPVAITTALQRLDIVRSGGGHDAVIVDTTQTIAGLVITLGTLQGQSLAEVQVGDWVRVADQTDWPALPREYHRLVADAASVKILTAKGETDRANAMAQVLGGDLGRYKAQLAERIKDQPNSSTAGSAKRRDQPLTDALLDSVRMAAGLTTKDETYTEWRICRELTDAVSLDLGDIVLKARSGMWLKQRNLTTTAARANYRLYHRAYAQGLETLEMSQDGLEFFQLEEVPASEAYLYDQQSSGLPTRFYLRGDQIILIPTPNASAYTLRQTFYLRPSLIGVQPVGSSASSGRARVSSVSTVARTITVSGGLPFDLYSRTDPTAVAAFQAIDVIHVSGSCEVSLLDAQYSSDDVSVFTITDATLNMNEIVNAFNDSVTGADIVRIAGQTDFPPLPQEFHRLCADLAAVRILRAKGDNKRADTVVDGLQGDMQRFRSSLLPRVKSQPKTTPLTLRSRGGGWPRWLP